MPDIPIIVSGMARCGTSLVMQMLDAGGFPVVGKYPAYEVIETSPVGFDLQWMEQQGGKAVKVLDPHHGFADFKHPRAVIWLDRDPWQQAKSHVKFLGALLQKNLDSQAGAIDRSLRDERSASMTAAGVYSHKWLAMRFEELIERPQESAAKLKEFLSPWHELDATRAAGVVRHRSSDCLPYLLEIELLGAKNAQ